jgi:hypothetical protein
LNPLTQTQVGDNGNCFATCLASILDMTTEQVPDFRPGTATDEEFFAAAAEFLADHGLSYRRTPVDGAKPSGYSTIEGISPRGGMHACVAYDGRMIHDPHPYDGTGRGLVEPRFYGLLEPL